eukprot:gene34266-41478_t
MTDQFIQQIQADMERRRRALEDDLRMNVAVEDKVVSERLANIKVEGLKGHLQQAKMKRQVFASQLFTDQQSHAVLTRADVHRKYHNS